jgi:hypothetical protein
MQTDIDRRTAEDLIRTKLIELIQLGSEHGIRIEHLMYEALDLADIEPPHSR